MNNNMSWLSLGNSNPLARETNLSNNYNDLSNRPIKSLIGTSQNPIKLWTLDVGLYIFDGYVQYTNALLSEAKGLFASITVGLSNGQYILSAFIPFWEGQYEYILSSLNSDTYINHQVIRMITQGNSLTLDNVREYTPSEEYHPSTKKYIDDTIEIMRNELGKMGLNNDDIQSLMKENRRRDIAIQALLSQNSDKMVTIDEEVHNISMDYSLDNGIATINTLEGDTLVNVSKDTEYDKILSYEQDIVENTNTVDLEVDGNLNPIIVGDTLVNVCTQNNPTAITNEYTVEGSNHFALQGEVEGNCRPIIQGNTIVNRSKTKDSTPLTTYVSEVEGNEMSLVDDTDAHVRVDKLVGDTMVNLWREENVITSCRATLENHRIKCITDSNKYHNFFINDISMIKPSTTYTCIVNIYKNTLNERVWIFSRNIANSECDIYTQNGSDGWCIEGGEVGQFKLVFTTPTEITAIRLFRSFVVNEIQIEGQEVELDIMLFEGDYTNKPIPQEYFEGLKNSYEDEYIEEAKNLSFTITGESDLNKRIIYFDDTCVFKPNTTYTVMLDLTIVEESDNMVIRISTNRGGGNGTSISIIKDEIKENHIIRTITTNNYVSTLAIYHVAADPTYGTSLGKVKINRLCILEGDYSSNPLTYEEVMEHGGQYRCEVEVQGENYNQTQTVYLNSPLLKGDEVVYKEGKLCHYHKMGEVVLDGSEEWIMHSFSYNQDTLYRFYVTINNMANGFEKVISNKFSVNNFRDYNLVNIESINNHPSEKSLNIWILKTKLGVSTNTTENIANFKQWLQANPTTVVYELANPYYETISTSELLLPITTNCKLLTSSNIPLTTMSTRVFTEEVNILANTQYSLNFNSDIASTVNITLGGTVLSNQAIVKGYNKFSITTPSTLVDNLLIIEGSGVNISEVVVTEYDEGVCEYIEGLKSSFEDGYLPENLATNSTSKLTLLTTNKAQAGNMINLNKPISSNTILTIAWRCTEITMKTPDSVTIAAYSSGGTWAGSIRQSYGSTNLDLGFGVATLTSNSEVINIAVVSTTGNNAGDTCTIEDVIILEGDWIHLTEEDFNHLGQYKVEYKMTGKNKFNPHLCSNPDFSINKNGEISYIPSNGDGRAWNYQSSEHKFRLNKGSYKVTITCIKSMSSVILYRGYDIRTKDDISLSYVYGTGFPYQAGEKYTTDLITLTEDTDLGLMLKINDGVYTVLIEEVIGGVATDYEPYKESIQTVYLNSPLLEGDTIEEIDGEVYHVHRMGKVVLDGSEGWNFCADILNTDTHSSLYFLKEDSIISGIILSDNFPIVNNELRYGYADCIGIGTSNNKPIISISISKIKLSTIDVNGFKQWLSENPTTVVYELATPTYELIPSSSIVCKSYPNGHLDFDTNVHIDNTVNFVKANLPITYANTSTNYTLQFVSDKDMENVTINALGNIMENVTINKGFNKITFTSPSDATNILTFEGLGYAYISNVQLVATDKEIGYFKRLYSTYECGLIEDESNENYGKYEVNIVSYNTPIQFGKGGKIE